MRLGLQPTVCRGSVSERHHLVDDGREPSGEKVDGCLAQLRLRAHVRTEQRQLAREEVPEIEPGLVPRGCTAGHEPTAARERADAAIPRGLTDMLDHDVGAA